MVVAVAQEPGFARMVGHEFVQRYYDHSFRSPGLVHKYYKDNSVMYRTNDDGSASKSTTIKDINRMILSVGYDKYLKVILKSMDAHSLDHGVNVRVTGSLIRKDGTTKGFSQWFILEQQAQKRGWYFVLYDVFRYTENVNKGSDIDVEDDDVVSDVEDGNKGLVRGDDVEDGAVKSRDGNTVFLVSDVEDSGVEDAHSHDGNMGSVEDSSVTDMEEEALCTTPNQADFGDLQDGSVMDAEPTAIKNEEEQVPESFGKTGGAPSSFSPGSGSKEGGWTVVSSKKYNRKREDETGSRSQKISRKESESKINTTRIDLHGETVKGARRIVKQKLKSLSSSGSVVHILEVITGRGLHSVDGIPRIKNSIIELLRKIKIEAKEESRGGVLVVTVDGETELILSSDTDTDHQPQPQPHTFSDYFCDLR